ncbi:hypothetical protein NX722_00960 [Endozoicomonas gorgoniicola]|uniref:Uncharacterized protein n=1 Tax=Endozoicomonas gorgoniicola TaxID=1234144 RepID=A0ABT3MPD5_9GAMM|nr:hypothetical protein [Endozoicomonas gorgoniicola]MCW7551232.1 hypothetical protein [Endozoicomonas gorgoniicola]
MACSFFIEGYRGAFELWRSAYIIATLFVDAKLREWKASWMQSFVDGKVVFVCCEKAKEVDSLRIRFDRCENERRFMGVQSYIVEGSPDA